jgi:hypothetical protein
MEQWHKSSLSSGGDNCVEVRRTTDGIELHHSRHPDAGTLSFTESEWAAFLGGVRLGEFD